MNQDLPPQAYTRETLQEAFNWLQEQPEPVRATVHTPERLVSLYQKAQRMNEFEAPVSSKKFIDDLKTLANSLDQFEGNYNAGKEMTFQAAARPMETPPPQPQTPPSTGPTIHFTNPVSSVSATFIESTTETKKSVVTTEVKATNPLLQEIDATSLERVREVKKRFNLGSEAEALRLLISLGFEKFSQFP